MKFLNKCRHDKIDEQNNETTTRAITGNITSATTRTKRTTLARTSAARSSLSDQKIMATATTRAKRTSLASGQKAASLLAHHAKYTPLTAKQTYSKHTTEAYSSKKFWLT